MAAAVFCLPDSDAVAAVCLSRVQGAIRMLQNGTSRILGQSLCEPNAQRVGKVASTLVSSGGWEVRPELVHGSNGRLKTDGGEENQEFFAPGSAHRDLRV